MSASDKVNILLVDDQPGKLLTYEAILNDLGENIIKASSGKEALEHLLRTDITVVLMDVSMPDLDGFELAQIIHQHPRYEKTAIIFVSAVHLTDFDRLKGYEAGAVDYVSVPVIPEILRAKVSVFIELYRKTQQLEHLNRDLEERVAARTSELQDSFARQTEMSEQLREADHRKDEFLALLAHELRNPLAAVRNAIQILQHKETTDPDVLWCRSVIDRQVDQWTRLVDDLLDVSRITHGKIKLKVEGLDFADLIAGAVETTRPLIDARHHELLLTLPEDPVWVMGDRARLTQVVANLLHNAAKYQEEGGHIALRVEPDGDEVVITVSDRGMGIPPDMLSSMFELFSQGEEAPGSARGGLGIGLFLVKTLVALHGGNVNAASHGPGSGSQFVVRLPRVSVAVARNGSAGNVEGPGPAAPGRPQHVLVVDDNRDGADSLAMLLRLKGHAVTVAHDGGTALGLAAAERPGVILLDIGLPGMDGYEVCRRLRERGFTDTLIIAVSGYGMEKDRERSQAAGFNHHVVKPVAIATLMSLIDGSSAPASAR